MKWYLGSNAKYGSKEALAALKVQNQCKVIYINSGLSKTVFSWISYVLIMTRVLDCAVTSRRNSIWATISINCKRSRIPWLFRICDIFLRIIILTDEVMKWTIVYYILKWIILWTRIRWGSKACRNELVRKKMSLELATMNSRGL